MEIAISKNEFAISNADFAMSEVEFAISVADNAKSRSDLAISDSEFAIPDRLTVNARPGKIFPQIASGWGQMRRHRANSAPTAIPSRFLMLLVVIHFIKYTVIIIVSSSYY